MEARLGPGPEESSLRRQRRSALPAHRPHRRRWLAIGIAVLVVAAAVDLPLAYFSSTRVSQDARSLNDSWSRDQSLGVSAASLDPLRRELAQLESRPWWYPGYWFYPEQARISSLRAATTATWNKALEEGRRLAATDLSDYRRLVTQDSAWLTSDQRSAASGWPAALARAQTPNRLRELSAGWELTLTRTRAASRQAQDDLVASVAVSSSGGLPAEAAAVQKLAGAAGVSELQLPQAAAALQAATSASKPTAALAAALSRQIYQVRLEIGLQAQVDNVAYTVMGLADQAAVEQVPGASGFLARYTAAEAAVGKAGTVAQLSAAQSGLNSLQQGVQGVLAANRCGHSSISGKSIYVSISLQEMVFYDSGCAVNSTPVTTGRPGEATPTGTFSIFLKRSPLEFVSGYSPGSPNYYTPFLAQYAMEFLSGGYYFHNAPWEPANDFGPSSQDNLYDASHGCVHTPLVALAWAYSWTPLGTPVVISA